MKRLILVRSGQIDPINGKLDRLGDELMNALAERFRLLVGKESILVFASPSARQSAEVLKEKISNARLEEYEILSESHGWDFSELLKLVRSRADSIETIIIVSHYDCINRFPVFFTKKEWGIPVHPEILSRGEARVMDCEKKMLFSISPQLSGKITEGSYRGM